jgi:hypothetical protein
MHRTPCAISFARSLIALSRARRTGVLVARCELDACHIAIVDGVPRAALLLREAEPLGDLLLRDGDLDVAAHLRALDAGAPDHPVGQWLVRAGAATRPAVEHALRDQLRARILGIFAWPTIDYTLQLGDAAVGVPWVSEPVVACDLVLTALRRMLHEPDVQRFEHEHAGLQMTLSSSGRWLSRHAALWPDEAAALCLLDQGTDLGALRATVDDSARALRTVAALGMLGAVVPRTSSTGSYPVLLRKQRQIRRRASAAELLDLRGDAPAAEARRALRRLAHSVHPDVFGPLAPSALRRASTEVMTGLARAEQDLRVASSAARRAR